jgi:FkbM family methyltransferase
MDLSKIGYPIKLFALPGVVVVDFVEQQYRCETSDGAIECKEDDYVVDAGGCWADTALYFAHKVGPKGRVASFEFLPDNLKVCRRNLEMNPVLAERVAVYEHPVWSQSGKELFVIGNGPATRVVPHTGDPNAFRIKTLKIDDLVARGEFPRVDFIKMDIEGAELEALKGSEAVLRMFKPRLAITVYHDFKDMWSIPNYLDSLGLGYRFYLRHFTIHAEETVLFARA